MQLAIPQPSLAELVLTSLASLLQQEAGLFLSLGIQMMSSAVRCLINKYLTQQDEFKCKLKCSDFPLID